MIWTDPPPSRVILLPPSMTMWTAVPPVDIGGLSVDVTENGHGVGAAVERDDPTALHRGGEGLRRCSSTAVPVPTTVVGWLVSTGLRLGRQGERGAGATRISGERKRPGPGVARRPARNTGIAGRVARASAAARARARPAAAAGPGSTRPGAAGRLAAVIAGTQATARARPLRRASLFLARGVVRGGARAAASDPKREREGKRKQDSFCTHRRSSLRSALFHATGE